MFLEKTLNLIFPTKCGLCGKIGFAICNNCQNKLKDYEINLIYNKCLKIEKNKIKITKMFIYKYDGIIRNLLINYKFNDYSFLSDTFAYLIKNNKKIYRNLKNYDIIIPVPLHNKRKLERGYNQVELIAKKLEIPMETTCLFKIKNIKPQSTKGYTERVFDVKGVYKLENIEKIKGKKIIIFDDIYTTGSTVNECINILGKFAKEIGVLIIAKD